MLNDDLSLKRLRELFSTELAVTGLLVWLPRPECRNGWNTRYAGKPAGRPDINGYLRVGINRKSYGVSRLIYCMVNGVELGSLKGYQIDHKDHDILNNHPSNLRKCSQSQNNRNRNGSPASASSRHLWVSFYKRTGRWRATLRNETGAHKHIGYFQTEADAVAAAENYRLK